MKDKKVKSWMRAAGIRAVKTMAQTAVATIGTAVALGEGSWNHDNRYQLRTYCLWCGIWISWFNKGV
ncbi:MAG: hypothetical protein HDR23_08995 [Lachnospiraceae bacterium]|nr:hypothetical protein [Lachnospiraceae bacterium]MBD5456584.1 hypothetical protein [Lachnospiraceae bacterium]